MKCLISRSCLMKERRGAETVLRWGRQRREEICWGGGGYNPFDGCVCVADGPCQGLDWAELAWIGNNKLFQKLLKSRCLSTIVIFRLFNKPGNAFLSRAVSLDLIIRAAI